MAHVLRMCARYIIDKYNGLIDTADQLARLRIVYKKLKDEIKDITTFSKCPDCGLEVSSQCLGCVIKELESENKKLNIILFHRENGLSHPDYNMEIELSKQAERIQELETTLRNISEVNPIVTMCPDPMALAKQALKKESN
jgi:hypothetical protein